MSKVNKKLIELNKIMELNSLIVNFNKKQINANQDLLKGNLVNKNEDSLTQEQLIEANIKVIDMLEKKIKENEKEIYSIAENSSDNANEILKIEIKF